MADNEVAVAPGVLDEEPVGIVAAGDHAGQIAAGHRGSHGCLVVGGHTGGRVDRNPDLLQ